MSVLKIKNSDGEWVSVPFINNTQKIGVVAGDNIELTPQGQDIKISAIVPDTSNLATKQELDTKQPIGNYAYVSDIPTLISQLENDSNLASNIRVDEVEDVAENAKAIAEGKATGYVFDTIEDMNAWVTANSSALKLGDNLYIRAIDVPDYWWDGTTVQQLETQKVDLTNYVKKTDYATSSKVGLMRPANGLFVSGNTGAIVIACASNAQIDAKTDKYYPIVPNNLNYAVNSVLPTMTQAEYDALATKNENLFYMIVEE
jgi:hypothetical protein